MDGEWLAERFEADRARLRAVAYRLLGSGSEADDAVQEAWLRLSRADAGEIENLGGWLTTVVARVCLDTLRSRLSAAYKGINVLVLREGSKDWFWKATIQELDADEVALDIHHIFPRDWCEKTGIGKDRYDSILNKTPISYKANRKIGGDAPSRYLSRIQREKQVSLGDAIGRQARIDAEREVPGLGLAVGGDPHGVLPRRSRRPPLRRGGPHDHPRKHRGAFVAHVPREAVDALRHPDPRRRHAEERRHLGIHALGEPGALRLRGAGEAAEHLPLRIEDGDGGNELVGRRKPNRVLGVVHGWYLP